MTLTLTENEKSLGWLFLLCQLLVVPFAASLVCRGMGIDSNAAANNICFFLNAALAVVIFRRLLVQSFHNCAGRWRELVLTVLKGFCLYYLVNTALNALIFTIQPDFFNVNDAGVSAMIDESPWLMPIAVIFAAPLAEECLCRGWMFTGLAQRSVPGAYCVTALFFGAIHISGYFGSYDARTLALCFLQYLGPSAVLCWTCRRADSLCAPLLLHMAINALACIVSR